MFYLILFVILLILAVIDTQHPDAPIHRVLVWMSAVMLILVAGLRYETGGDWDTYLTIFQHIPPLDEIPWGKYHCRYCEMGFAMLCATIKWMGGGIQTLFLVVTTFNTLLITKGLCRYTKYPVLGLLCYYCILYFNLEMIYIRQAMAVAICFYALHCIEDKQPVRYILWLILAFMLHRMALVMLLLYPMARMSLPKWVYAAIIGIGAVVMLIGINWFTQLFTTVTGWLGTGFVEKARIYTGSSSVFSINRRLSIGFFLNLAILAVILYFKENICQRKYGTTHLNMFVLSLAIYYYGADLIEVSNRFRYFFLISIIALLPMIVEGIEVRATKAISIAVIVLYGWSFSMRIFLERPQAIAYNPYQNYVVYRIQEKSSTGKMRLEQSHKQFNKERRR